MKKILALLLAIILIFTLVGCGSSYKEAKEKIKSVCQMMSDLRDSWVQAESTTTTSVSSLSPAISITG